MNERIQALAEQAEILFYKGRIPETGYEYEGAEVTKEDLEKFAELIVRECAEVSKNYAGGSMPVSIASAIKQHFGVK